MEHHKWHYQRKSCDCWMTFAQSSWSRCYWNKQKWSFGNEPLGKRLPIITQEDSRKGKDTVQLSRTNFNYLNLEILFSFSTMSGFNQKTPCTFSTSDLEFCIHQSFLVFPHLQSRSMLDREMKPCEWKHSVITKLESAFPHKHMLEAYWGCIDHFFNLNFRIPSLCILNIILTRCFEYTCFKNKVINSISTMCITPTETRMLPLGLHTLVKKWSVKSHRTMKSLKLGRTLRMLSIPTPCSKQDSFHHYMWLLRVSLRLSNSLCAFRLAAKKDYAGGWPTAYKVKFGSPKMHSSSRGTGSLLPVPLQSITAAQSNAQGQHDRGCLSFGLWCPQPVTLQSSCEDGVWKVWSWEGAVRGGGDEISGNICC